MSALMPDQARSMRIDAAAAGNLAERWRSLHDQSCRLAILAELSPEPFAGEIEAFLDRLALASDWRRNVIEQHISDMAAMMQPGMTAIDTLVSRDVSAHAPALALWREFYNARETVLALVRPEEFAPA
ncbi:MAG: hypothetical protein SXU28_00195 [Pseudomonadota bacterium]|nr:hypothetical protein [Pseudomonadota bacterium]